MIAPRAWLTGLAVTFLVAASACSSSGRKDQFYGTDVGVNWVPPDATARDAPGDASAADTTENTAEAGTDTLDAGADAAPSADAPAGDT